MWLSVLVLNIFLIIQIFAQLKGYNWNVASLYELLYALTALGAVFETCATRTTHIRICLAGRKRVIYNTIILHTSNFSIVFSHVYDLILCHL